jgi:hypothetical protein
VHACDQTVVTVSPQPIPLGLTAPSGPAAVYALATVDGVPTPFPVTVDTGSPLTAYDDGMGTRSARTGGLRLYAAAPSVPRLDLHPVLLFVQPMGRVGVGDGFPLGGVFGGDNLSRFAAVFDYRTAPTVALQPMITASDCELSLDCDSRFSFGQLLGGTQGLPNDPRIAVGSNLYTYPATRVVLDACLEPLADPLSRDQPCTYDTPPAGKGLWPQYLPSGIDVQVLIASGFPGLGVSAGAFDRLRGAGAAGAALAMAPVQLHLSDVADDGTDHRGLTVATATLGDGTHAALTFVSRELYNNASLGPCEELARARRLRRFHSAVAHGGNNPEAGCTLVPPSPYLIGCTDNGPRCVDQPDANAAASVELAAQLPAFVMPDTAPLLVGINADVRPQGATVEAVIGTEALRRLVTTVDYQNAQVILRCASDGDCLAYPRQTAQRGVDCTLLANGCYVDCITDRTTGSIVRPGDACPPAP